MYVTMQITFLTHAQIRFDLHVRESLASLSSAMAFSRLRRMTLAWPLRDSLDKLGFIQTVTPFNAHKHALFDEVGEGRPKWAPEVKWATPSQQIW